MSTTLGSQSASGGVRVNGHSPWVWALRRTALGILILTVTIGAAAWLMYAGIDPAAEASNEARAALRNTTILDSPAVRPPMRPAGTLASQ